MKSDLKPFPVISPIFSQFFHPNLHTKWMNGAHLHINERPPCFRWCCPTLAATGATMEATRPPTLRWRSRPPRRGRRGRAARPTAAAAAAPRRRRLRRPPPRRWPRRANSNWTKLHAATAGSSSQRSVLIWISPR